MKSKAKIALSLLATGTLLVMFQNFTPASISASSGSVIDDETDVDDPTGDPDKGAVTGNCPEMTSNQLLLPIKEIEAGGSKPVILKKASYYHKGELHLTSPVTIEGQGRGKTKITICISPKASAIHIESKNVTIKGISIEVALRDKLMNGGSGEYGTGITMGRYFSRSALVPVSNIKIENIGISRAKLANGSRSFTGNAIVAVGNVSDVDIKDVVLSNAHSIGFLTHWGGQLPSKCEYDHAFEVFTDGGNRLLCPVIKTHHPHNVKVDGLETAPLTNALIMLSSSYNISVSNVSGSAPMILQILPGDEGIKYASAAEAKLIGSNIKVDKVVGNATGVNPMLPLIRISGKGGSKWDRSTNDVHFKNLTVSNFEINATPEERLNFRQRKYSFVSKYGRGSNINLTNIDFNDAGRPLSYSFGAVLSYSKGIHFSGIKTQAKNGFLVKNSQDISIKDSFIRRSETVASSPNASLSEMSRGILIQDEDRGKDHPFPGYANSVIVSNNVISGYDVGIRVFSINFRNGKTTDVCDRVQLDSDNQVSALLMPYQGKSCP